jgi:hypothetical protein
MDYAAIAWPKHNRLRPFVFLEVCRDPEIYVLIHRLGVQMVLFRHLKNYIRLGDFGLVGPSRPGGLDWITRFYALINPCDYLPNLFLAQSSIVGKFAKPRIRVPRRHLSSNDFLAYQWRIVSDLLVGSERHWRDVTWVVALGAVALQDRRNVFVECDMRFRSPADASGERRRDA